MPRVGAQWVGRGTEQSAVLAEAEAIARTLSDPLILSDARQTRAHCVSFAGSSAVGERFADDALDLATAAGDDWAIAQAAFSKATQAPTVGELRERVDRAAALLDEVGNVYRLADLLAGVAAYGSLCMGSDQDAMEFVGRAVPLVRELDNPFIWMILQGNLGLAALLTGDTDAAREAFREELVLSRDLVARPIASEGLSGLAAVAVVCGDAERAAILVGAAAAHRYGEVPSLVDARLDAEFFEPARKRRGAAEWDAAVHDGGTLSFMDAIAYALRERDA